ncbi:MAG: hypothetical protein V5A88_08615 [Candidatus Thermoplasmatota archaeon]
MDADIDDLLKKMHEKKAKTPEFLQENYSKEELVQLEEAVNKKIRISR